MRIDTYEEFCRLEERRGALFKDIVSFQNEVMEIVTNLSGNVLTVFGIGGSMEVIGSVTCADARRAAIWTGIMFLLGLPIPFLMAWKRLKLKEHLSEHLRTREADLQHGMKRCLVTLSKKPMEKRSHFDHMGRTDDFNRRVELASVDMGPGEDMGPIELTEYYKMFKSILMIARHW